MAQFTAVLINLGLTIILFAIVVQAKSGNMGENVNSKAEPIVKVMKKNWAFIAGGLLGGLFVLQAVFFMIGKCQKPGRPMSNTRNRVGPKDPESDPYYDQDTRNFNY